VVIWGGLIYPYLVPKTLLFYALSLLSVAVFALLVARGVSFRWGRLGNREAWIPGALLALAYLASAFGLGFYHSFWSLFVRGDGLLMLTCAVADFYLILLYADRAFFEKLLRAAAILGSLVATYGIAEWLISGGRIGSLIGNAAFFAGYLGVTLFATIAASRNLSKNARRWAYAGALAQAVAIVLSATRGTILALGVAVLCMLGYLALHGKGTHKRSSAYALAAILIFGGLFFAFRASFAHFPFAPIARVATISTNDPDIANRLFIWKHMAAEIASHPVLGVGAEHIDALFNQFYDPSKITEQWFDRSHNAFLDYAAQYGIGGLLLYLALIGSLFASARRFWKRGETTLAYALALLGIVYAVQDFFAFDTVSVFWLLLALISAALALSARETERTALALSAPLRFLLWPFAALLVLLIIPVSIYPLIAAYDLAHAYGYQLADPAKSATYLKNGFSLGTYGDIEYGYEAYDMYVTQSVHLTGDALANAYGAASTILSADFDRYPYDARTALNYAHVLSLAPPGIAADTERLSAALERAIRLSPKRTQPWYILVNLSISQANQNPIGSKARADGYAAALDLLDRYLMLVPELSQPYFVKAQLEYAQGEAAAAQADAAKGKQYYEPDLQTARRAISYYETVKDWASARFFLESAVELSGGDPTLQFELAKVEYVGGDPSSAAKIVAVLRATAPQLLATDPAFMAAITAYEQSQR
ncbi:MAG TPA: O-antigen ligase family protein, partial [Candidatus Paceibacterota bacterium]|nr:O-antigen ligase family protein [Candidatus Paceibacterota bacterium]